MAKTQNFELDQGADKTITFIVFDNIEGVPFDLTDWSPRMMVKQTFDQRDPTMSFTLGDGITMQPTNGIINVFIAVTDSVNLSGFDTKGKLKLIYDLEIQHNTDIPLNIHRIFQGSMTVFRNVTTE